MILREYLKHVKSYHSRRHCGLCFSLHISNFSNYIHLKHCTLIIYLGTVSRQINKAAATNHFRHFFIKLHKK